MDAVCIPGVDKVVKPVLFCVISFSTAHRNTLCDVAFCAICLPKRNSFLLLLTVLYNTMNRFISSLLILVALVASSEGFAPSSLGGISGGELS